MKSLDEIKIVIVEDEKISSDELKYIISKDNRFKVVGQAYDGISAITLIENEEPEVVLIDINIPGKNGIELAEEIKSILPDTILIFLTAYDSYAIKAFELKIYDYILKPYDEKRIAESLNCVVSTIISKNENQITDKSDNKQIVFWYLSHFLLEFEEEKKYVMQNEIRRLSNEVYRPRLQTVKEKLQENVMGAEKKELEKQEKLLSEAVKTLEAWKVVN